MESQETLIIMFWTPTALKVKVNQLTKLYAENYLLPYFTWE